MTTEEIVQAAMRSTSITDAIRFAIAKEREACAAICEKLGMATNGIHKRNHECAVAIRARGEK